MAADGAGNGYVTGSTVKSATGYPTTAGAFDTTPNGGEEDVFIVKLNPIGTGQIYGTYLGRSSLDVGSGLAVDAAGNA